MLSIWEKESFLAPQDVLVAGAGLAGLWSAFYLKKKEPALKITIVDKGIFPTGASTRNAGFACFGSLSEVMYDIKTMGLDATLSLVEKRFKGLKRIQKHLSASAIDFKKCGGYELFGGTAPYTKEELENSIGYLNSLLKEITGKKQTYSLAEDKIKEFGFGHTTHLVLNSEEGYLHSGKMVQLLLQTVMGLGVNYMPCTAVESFVNNNSGIEVKTANGLTLQTSKLLICTNGFAQDLLPSEEIIPARGQVIVTSPIKDLPIRGTFHADEGFYYFRNLGNRILLGGARNLAFDEENTADLQTSPRIQNELERYLSQVVMPNIKTNYTIDHRWSGIMGMGPEKAPIVKEVQPHIFCAVGLGGMGVALAPAAAQEVVGLMY